jgi:hypothetical protein
MGHLNIGPQRPVFDRIMDVVPMANIKSALLIFTSWESV